MTDLAAQKSKLLARLGELDQRLARIEESLDAPHNPDFEEDATEREGDEVREQLGEAGLLEIRQIRAALQRLRVGGYGVCVACGENISPERLIAVPTAARCRNCV
ncbi:MAG: TraR/DksA C4-type zinc finger protein [Rhodobacteraceae bacterium]|nr:TraR/DksA C4-type zinc finger protein [Paracoccaceae bacterium]